MELNLNSWMYFTHEKAADRKSAVDEEALVEAHNMISETLVQTAKKSAGKDFSTPTS
ncbi:MAG: hypothetical protein K9M49_06085 [Candidatus Marinimicrobia bacterium]|nr:hypothetical protein [Candidatus Neomarinimicrobiota bacterium]MCF7904704.1 hypothetical protein [Candidatus Neomarinimicrobiota bacterium]